jgi:hypothetical protein
MIHSYSTVAQISLLLMCRKVALFLIALVSRCAPLKVHHGTVVLPHLECWPDQGSVPEPRLGTRQNPMKLYTSYAACLGSACALVYESTLSCSCPSYFASIGSRCCKMSLAANSMSIGRVDISWLTCEVIKHFEYRRQKIVGRLKVLLSR